MDGGPRLRYSSAFEAVLTLLINLARRRDRLAVMSAQLGKLAIDFERFDAIDGSTLEPPQGAELTPAEIACHRSHRACWQRLIESTEPRAVILEDDLVISPRLGGFLARPELWPDDADIIRLETFGQIANLSTRNIKAPSGIRLHRLLTEQYGAAAYVISRACATRLLLDDQSAKVPVDTMMYGRAAPGAGGLFIYQADPALCIQGKVHFTDAAPAAMDSDIEPLRRVRYARLPAPRPETPLTGLARIVQEAKRVARPLYRSWVFGDRERRIEFDKSGDPTSGTTSTRRFA
jgi:glycosyl transferase family 25